MNVKVNLLPPEIAERQRARRITRLTVALVTVWVLLLGGVYMLKLAEVADAHQVRDAAQAEVVALQSEVSKLEKYRVLAERLDAHNGLLASAMASEISWARVFNDLALAYPANSSLVSLNAMVEVPAEESVVSPEGQVDLGDPVATITFSGYSLERYAPGIKSVLVDFEDARGFFSSYLQTAGEKLIGDTQVIEFNGTVRMDEEAHTNRYEDGLPPEVAE